MILYIIKLTSISINFLMKYINQFIIISLIFYCNEYYFCNIENIILYYLIFIILIFPTHLFFI